MRVGGSKINKRVLLNIVSQINELREMGHSVIVVTSGAVASCQNKRYSKSLRASIGQPKLINIYSIFFNIFNIEICQLLYTREDLKGARSGYTKKLLLEIIKNNIVPVINANDSVSGEELDALKEYADNDVLASRVALMIRADIVFILIQEDGLIDFSNGRIINKATDFNRAMRLAKSRSSLGSGGMRSKIRVAKFLNKNNIEVRLLPGYKKDAILNSLKGENIGTILRIK